MISKYIANANVAQSYRQALMRLYWLRVVTLVSQFIVVALVFWGLQIKLNFVPLLLIIIFLGVFNLLVYWRLKKQWTVSSIEIAINLTIDVLALAALLYFAGGSTNPLVSLFIIPVALSAVFLQVIYIIWMVVLTSFLYTLLMEWYVPLPSMGSRFGGDFNLHIFGMYANFIFSAVLIAIFVYALASTSRRHEQELALSREKIIRNRHVVEAGLMAANAAHEINTPLSTIGLLADELLADKRQTDEQQEKKNYRNIQAIEDIIEIQKQVSYCKKQLEMLQHKATLPASIETTHTLEQGIADTLENRSELHPEITLCTNMLMSGKTAFSELNSLLQTLVNLLDNAADASLKAGNSQVDVSIKRSGALLIINVDDYGGGLSKQQLSQLGKKPYTSKPDGMGIGLLLSHTSLDHLGGHILLSNRSKDSKTSGIRANITLPLTS